jgi:hypothetical protein
LSKGNLFSDLDRYGKMGVDALSRATPRETGKTASSWSYRVNRGATQTSLEWFNTNVNDGKQIAILLQMGHGTGTGGYVAGYDYINPAMRPIFDQIATDIGKRVSSI